MLSNIGFSELLFIALVGLLLFGPNKLPELGRTVGKALREFKMGASELMNDVSAGAKPVNPSALPVQEAVKVQENEKQAAQGEKSQESSLERPIDTRRLPD